MIGTPSIAAPQVVFLDQNLRETRGDLKLIQSVKAKAGNANMNNISASI